ncbi:alanine racemase [Methylophaga sp. 42_8_T64]|nr:alanine racemase [Methylophaga sp. 42_8_T64]
MNSYPVASIDLAALKHNFDRIKQLAPTSRIISVIKANAYGHGYAEVANVLTDSDAFAVARLVEGIQLRKSGITHKIILLEGVMTAAEIQLAAQYDLSPVFHHRSQIQLLSTPLTKPLQFCWLMIETGMHRLGFAKTDVAELITTMETSEAISGDVGLMSHFANADLVGDDRNQQQLDITLHCADKQRCEVSLANSAAILSFPASHQQWLRPGLMLYGVSPFDDKTAVELDLKPVMQLKSVLTAKQTLQAGDQVGYGGDWTATKVTEIGIVSIGYGDGYSRYLSNAGQVMINGQRVTVLGRVSMDMICIDLHTCSDADVGDEVLLWGGEQLPVEWLAKQANTIPYELLCQLNPRVRREYHHGQS